MPRHDHENARSLLENAFAGAEQCFHRHIAPAWEKQHAERLDALFESRTQAFREVLIGCALAKATIPGVDVHLPYANMGDRAFNGRTLDEQVVNPFLQTKQLPCSRGPYLSVFRRSVRFTAATRSGLRDRETYDKFLKLVELVDGGTVSCAKQVLVSLLYRFLLLREQSMVALARVKRLSLPQCARLIARLLSVPSGGRFPVDIATAVLAATNDRFTLGWRIESQGINVADIASGAAGDITVTARSGERVIAAEVTERPVTADRIVATFNAKIAPAEIADYLFLVRNAADPKATEQLAAYFAQGHELNVVSLQDWATMTLATIGGAGRSAFLGRMLERLDGQATPNHLKMAWNAAIESLAAGE
jgi:hypothetical protein